LSIGGVKQLHGLLAFVEAATTGSLTAAARRLELTPAAVSKSVLRLEAELGVRLFNRTTRRIALTDEGARFLVDARGALRALDDAVTNASRAATEPTGRVRISVGIAFGRKWVLPALPKLLAKHRALKVEVDLDNRPVDLVAEGYDIGIRGGASEDSALVARKICKLPVVLVASPGYLKQVGVPTRAADLAAHRCIGVRLRGKPPSSWFFRRAIDARGSKAFSPDAFLSVNEPEAVLEPALAGAGVAQVALHHALPHLRAGRLKLILTETHDGGERDYLLHYPHRQFLAPRVRVVVATLLDAFREAKDLGVTVDAFIAERPDVVAS
jgi:DNA-binding transcriptional LysR family regulator